MRCKSAEGQDAFGLSAIGFGGGWLWLAPIGIIRSNMCWLPNSSPNVEAIR